MSTAGAGRAPRDRTIDLAGDGKIILVVGVAQLGKGKSFSADEAAVRSIVQSPCSRRI